ncbi:Hypothetical_protein [Hexamita inflata]|uniref:Hypothetical_protein n=1 Tax=Hexamita inflata TaxID=28002 RepID=A0AA86UKJ7_9EUKA|nr:Hypothetical protein HINF_LOCUS42467 [Hexamita inflata]
MQIIVNALTYSLLSFWCGKLFHFNPEKLNNYSSFLQPIPFCLKLFSLSKVIHYLFEYIPVRVFNSICINRFRLIRVCAEIASDSVWSESGFQILCRIQERIRTEELK